jgi:hypothetical protein|tara:strand:- start:4 stop:1026 length:1023 start_codon:yes stop_codon:yes gene_type:complete
MHSVRPTTLINRIKSNLKSGLNTMVWGGPGIGKSEIVQQVADELGVSLVDFRANLFDPVDVRGVPHIMQVKETGKRYTRWAVPDVFPIAERDGENGIMFIDELSTAPPATQNAFLQLLLTRQVGDYELPNGWSVVAAGNRLTDAAAVYQMPAPLRDRFSHYELDVNYEDWCEWAVSKRVDPLVVSFIRYRTNLLYNFSADEYAFPTPRSWVFVHKLLSKEAENTDQQELYYGVSSLVGDGPAGEFIAFKEVADKLPDVDELIKDPSIYKKDDNPAILYALTGAVSARATDDKMENIMKLNKKLPVEFQVILVKGCLSVDKQLKSNPDVKKWIIDNANVVL